MRSGGGKGSHDEVKLIRRCELVVNIEKCTRHKKAAENENVHDIRMRMRTRTHNERASDDDDEICTLQILQLRLIYIMLSTR